MDMLNKHTLRMNLRGAREQDIVGAKLKEFMTESAMNLRTQFANPGENYGKTVNVLGTSFSPLASNLLRKLKLGLQSMVVM